ncbi:MAG: hypothetical protein P8J45_02495 [Phycisphaerales bacterium]|jgi:hypothetical protein|nr:hypothetical protein [Phycisphaerales bacterium]
MSFFGGIIETSLAHLAQTQRTAAEGKDRERALGESARRAGDSVTLKVAGLEHVSAVRNSENDDLEEKERRKHRQSRDGDSPEEGEDPLDGCPPKIDIRA